MAKNNFAEALNKLKKDDKGATLQETTQPRYKTTKQISVYLDEDAIEFMKAKKLNRTEIVNTSVIEHLKANYEY